MIHIAQTVYRIPRARGTTCIDVEHDIKDCDPDKFDVEYVIASWKVEQAADSNSHSNFAGQVGNKPYACDHKSCEKKYTIITHLNSHRIKKSHGKPLRKEDFVK